MSVTLYSQPGCQPCKRTKILLEKYEIDHTVVDIREDEEGFKRVQELGYLAVPVIELSTGEHWDGLRPDRLKALAELVSA